MTKAIHTDEVMVSAIEELKTLIRSYDPGARFEISAGPDGGDTYLVATVDTEDADEVMDVYIDRLVELQVEDRLPLYVLSLQADKNVTDNKASHGELERKSAV